MTPRPRRPGRRELAPLLNLFLLLPLFLFVWVLFRTAWLSDDAYISFRSVENLIRGHGPVWNPGERVQAFSHPLWFMVIAPLRAITGELFYTVHFLSILLSMGSVILLAFAGRAPWPRRLLAVTFCCFSAAFVDYSSSGLENPLSHFILAIFFFAIFRQQPALPRSVFILSLIAALGVLNRLDAMLIYGPALAGELMFRLRSAAAVLPASEDSGFWHDRGTLSGGELVSQFLGIAFLGFMPLILWEVFSVLYYGFPFPNPAYAKLNTGIARPELLEQGMYYLLHSARHDPVTIGVLVGGVGAGLLEPSGRARGFATGIVLYVAYTLWVGGDFMAGRFFSVPFFLSALLIGEVSLSKISIGARWLLGVFLAGLPLLSLVIAPTRSPVLSGLDYPDRPPNSILYDWRGIADERGAYYPWTGLLREKFDENIPESHEWARMGAEMAQDPPSVAVLPGIGFAGWQLGDACYAVDLNALTDPLLARLPAIQQPPWRIGHFTRVAPPGYLPALVDESVPIEDKEIEAYYSDLRRVVRGPIFTKERFRAMWRLNLHPKPAYPDWDYYQKPPAEYRTPARRHYPAAAFSPTEPPVTLPSGQTFAIYWDSPTRSKGIVFAPRPSTNYDVIISRGGVELGQFLVRRQPRESAGGPPDEAAAIIAVPARIAREGWDNVAFYPREFSGPQLLRTVRPVRKPQS